MILSAVLHAYAPKTALERLIVTSSVSKEHWVVVIAPPIAVPALSAANALEMQAVPTKRLISNFFISDSPIL